MLVYSAGEPLFIFCNNRLLSNAKYMVAFILMNVRF